MMGVYGVAACLAALLLFTTADVSPEGGVSESDDTILYENKPRYSDSVKYERYVEELDDILQVVDDEDEMSPYEPSLKFDTIYKPIELMQEEQLNDQYPSSDEQFVAVRNVGGDWCANCPTDVSVTADGVAELAEKAVQHLDRHKPNEKHALKNILRVQRQAQITNGVRYILLLDIETTSCISNDVNVVIDDNCQDIKTETNVCQITFLEKPWLKLNDGSKFRAVISNNCTEEYIFGDDGEVVSDNTNNVINPDSDISKVVNKDLLAVQKPVVDQEITEERLKNVEEQIITDTDKLIEVTTQVVENLDQVVQKVVIENIAANPDVEEENNESVTVEIPTTTPGLSDDKKQMVDGLLDLFGFDDAKINIDDSVKTQVKRNTNATVDSNSSESSEEIKKKKTEPKKKVDTSEENSSEEKLTTTPEPMIVRARRSLRVKNSSELDKLNIENLAKFAVDTLDDFDSDDSKRVVLDILSADKTYQSSNTIYFLKLKVGISKCKEFMQNKCESMIIDGKSKTCHVQIEVKPNGDKKVVKSQCINKNYPIKRSRRDSGLVGGPMQIALPDEKINKLVHSAIKQYDSSSSNDNCHSVIKINSATKKIVSGISTKIKFEVKEGSLPKGNTDSKTCQLSENATNKMCIATVWEKPWLNDTKTSIKCAPFTSRNKRDVAGKNKLKKFQKKNTGILVGGPRPLDLPDSNVDDLAKLSLYKFDVDASSDYHHKIIRVISATTQVVSGVLTKINFEVKRTNCTKLDIDNNESCEYLQQSRTKLCNASIWDRPWLNDGKEINIHCEPVAKLTEQTLEEDQFDRLREFINATKAFGQFVAKYNKPYMYDHNEFRKRFNIFQKNLIAIKELNDNEMGSAVYGVNMFADLSPKEFRESRLGLRHDLHHENAIPWPEAEIPDMDDIPDAFDWRDKGAVTEVKNQGSCGSCWAFSVTGNVEGQWKIKNGNLLSLSEQELVDCDKLDEGCNGGLPDQAYRAIEQLGGLELEKDYPYDAQDEKCSFNKSMAKVQISGAVNISTDETEMAKWLVQNGPISIGINANAMQFYMGGVSHPLKFLCSPKNLNHGVLIVGYGIHDYSIFKKKLPYWIVKNSWGPEWGEKGYYRVYRGDGTCGVNQMASSSII